jgi:hypothetical protein
MRRALLPLALLLLPSLALTGCRTPKPADEAEDGLIDGASEDTDGDGFTGAEDCAEGDAAVNAGAPERCDGIDNDCDGEVDEGVLDAYFIDADQDGFGDPAARVEACSPPADAVTAGTDCDDGDPSVYPSAAELCDGVDNDCDGVVDDDEVVSWFTDADGDGFGDPAAEVLSCAPIAGAVTVSGDCDDTTAEVYPGGPERCDERDNDCDGAVDEEVGATWYQDQDGDGFGLADRTTAACAAPVGYAALAGDCDDLDAAFNPGAAEDDCSDPTDYNCDGSVAFADADADGFAACQDCDDADPDARPDAVEVCNGGDDDCDGLVDDADPGLDLSTGSTFYDDDDSDGYGDLADPVRACRAPAGAVADATDCDDRDAGRSPGLLERCGGGDEDCDGLVDDADPSLSLSSAGVWHRDADADRFGDPADLVRACAAPVGRVADDQDCDDASPWIYPGAPERPDGEDNDCDGVGDEDLHLGSGADGDLVVAGVFDLSTDASGTRAHPDGISFPVASIGAASVTVDGPLEGIAPGDEVLIINLQGAPGRTAAVGRYALEAVTGVSGDTLRFARPLTAVFGELSNADIADQIIVVVRVPNYRSVSVGAAGVITTGAWDGLGGGVLALRAQTTLQIAAGGSLSAAALGYAGGGTGPAYNCDSYQGESTPGPGDGAAFGTCAAYNETYGLWAANAGGGGAHICGGGGAYGPGATATDSWNGGAATPAQAGVAYGSADLSRLFLGSGGGGVWQGTTACVGTGPGPGGDGGGLLLVTAGALTASGPAALLADGGSTTHCAKGSWEYGAGGGAGGSLWLVADTLSLAVGAVDAAGGSGEKRNIRRGGDGGVGRVRIDCGSCNGAPLGSTAATAALAAAADPDPGFGITP